jgi:RND family efflux transporter MFP subunit
MRRFVTFFLVLAIVVAIGLLTYRFATQEKQAATPTYDTVRVEKGDLISTVSASGTIEPEDEIVLVFKTPGRVSEVGVKAGQTVQTGDLIARLESDDLNIGLAQAETGLAIAQAQLAKLLAGASTTDLAAAQANVESAEASVASAEAALVSAEAAYAELLAGPSADQKEAAAANLERARIMRDQAQALYDQVAGAPNAGMLPQSLQLQQATVDYNGALASYRQVTAAAKPSQLAAARAQIAQAKAAVAQSKAALGSAQANLDRLQQGATTEDQAIAEAQVTQAQLALQQARLARENSELFAPISGVISQLNIKPGELASQAAPAAVVTDVDRFHITLQVDEIDIGKLREGQIVAIALDSAPEAAITGHVDYIAPTPTTPSNVVTYEVIVVIDDSSLPLRSGLSATASVITEELNDALVIPNRSIQIDRASGRTYVQKLVDGVPVRTEVQLGARNDMQSQVVSGLEAGDHLAIGSSGAFESIRSGFMGQ